MLDSEFIRNSIDKVIAQSKNKIKCEIWSGLDVGRIEKWFGNFISDEERLLAACLLDSLIYRSESQFKSQLFSIFTSPELKVDPDKKSDFDIISLLRSEKEESIHIIPVIRHNDPPTKSGPLVLRYAQRSLRFHNKRLKWPSQIEGIVDTSKVVILLDDFIGTGTQFVSFAKRTALHQILEIPNAPVIYYCVTAAHEKGLEKIAEELPGIRVISSEVLGNDNSPFTPEGWKNYEPHFSLDDALSTYKSICKRFPFLNKHPFGWGNLGLAYSFHHATPNNTLPIYWKYGDGWNSLLDR